MILLHCLTADKREIENFPRLPLVISFILRMLGEILADIMTFW